MASLTISFTRTDHLADFGAIFESVAVGELTALCEQGVGLAQARSPIDQGFYRNSITSKVTKAGDGVIEGQIYSTAAPIVVEVIENGRKPGRFPPVDIIRAWVGRKFAIADLKIRNSVAYLVGRKIAMRGIIGKFVFKNTFTEMQPQIQQASENVAAKVAARLAA